ncbi:MAG: hypothetical protein CML46_17530 [Rhodobacteraceae bacterium]|nr:hypothetical protein [Paracoccaceae bacterium]MBR28718.1 hypothetical protein [Paracoccaceae bacterium]
MSYEASAALQAAIFVTLSGSLELAALTGDRIWDTPPHEDGTGHEAGIYVLIGEERVSDWSAQGLRGSAHEVEISVLAEDAGFAAAKEAAGLIDASITGALPPLSSGRVASVDFVGVRARREKDGGRRIDLRFRFRIEH